MQIDMDAVIKPREWPNSARFLVAANFFPIVMILFLGWSMADFLFLYWCETAIIGFFNIFKMILSAPHPLGPAQTRISPKLDAALSAGAKIFVCAFFIVHFGGFMFVHGFFLAGISQHFRFVHTDIKLIDILLNVKWALLVLVASHGYSFFANYLAGGEYKTARISVLIHQPYPRIIVMHITILAGVFIMIIIGKSSVFMVLFAILKTVADLKAHLKERGKFRI